MQFFIRQLQFVLDLVNFGIQVPYLLIQLLLLDKLLLQEAIGVHTEQVLGDI